ncbi:hypothetical protein BDN71DRAFT_488006 [Pleurotus eryngii]|uniref:Uncharacterized protein n=1 Tax=Pleurotus eryngii TaxID=5323 RepID=A0A9P6A8A7_PLEER|nr:hypothetical protein BDN71DRAFT_488006 [Pleurotus eryngii]
MTKEREHDRASKHELECDGSCDGDIRRGERGCGQTPSDDAWCAHHQLLIALIYGASLAREWRGNDIGGSGTKSYCNMRSERISPDPLVRRRTCFVLTASLPQISVITDMIQLLGLGYDYANTPFPNSLNKESMITPTTLLYRTSSTSGAGAKDEITRINQATDYVSIYEVCEGGRECRNRNDDATNNSMAAPIEQRKQTVWLLGRLTVEVEMDDETRNEQQSEAVVGRYADEHTANE